MAASRQVDLPSQSTCRLRISNKAPNMPGDCKQCQDHAMDDNLYVRYELVLVEGQLLHKCSLFSHAEHEGVLSGLI
jgi:hypothetical protein